MADRRPRCGRPHFARVSEVEARSQQLGIVLAVIAVVIVFVMVTKPTLWG
jgi:hypothetical protein